ncbi:transglycosylase SLT domain-containing protein [Actibacterium lipolyticum]|nr:transglycosylase SLT domain-containing protein [Actibacterium lipolyticum]
MKNVVLIVALLMLPAGCGAREAQVEAEVVTMGTSVSPTLPVMRWDAQRPSAQAEAWTRASLKALETHGAELAEIVPADIENYCPAYVDAPMPNRRAFWAGLFSALAKHESTWNPKAVGGGGKWYGLVQISPATARGYGCAARTGDALTDGKANLSCAIRIAAHTVARDGVVSAGGRGIAADWGPFHSQRKRADIIKWTNAQDYCQSPG